MAKVFFTSTKKNLVENLSKLTPGCSGKWGTLEQVFDINKSEYVVILEDTPDEKKDIQESFEQNRTVIAFPLDLSLRKRYLRFHFPHRYGWGSEQGRVVCRFPGNYTYDELVNMRPPEKTKTMSCVLYKDTLPSIVEWVKKVAHRRAIDLYGYDHNIGELSQYLGPGDGVIEYKKYQRTFVFEETNRENYFTERLTNPILMWCRPWYWGCTTLNKIFNYAGHIQLSISKETTFDQVIHHMSSNNIADSLEPVIDSVFTKARQQVLDELNVWACVEKISFKGLPSVCTRSEKVFPNMNVAKDGICLVMIVRDESHVIERCLDSVVEVISSYLICDTGSLDNTPQVIEKYMDSKGVPGQVIYKEWKNFGFNKDYLLQRAYKDNLALGAKYLIWLDADEVFLNREGENLTVKDRKKLLDFANSHPKHSIFMFLTKYGGLEYQRWNMVRNNQQYRWNCPVHEWLSSTKPAGTIFVDFIVDFARKEGARTQAGNSGRKDIKMFEEHLKEKPGCSRCVFYLAQTLGEKGDIEKAIEMYEKRLTMAGFYQECYIAAMRVGHFYIKLRRPDKAFDAWTKGQKIVPTRLEIPFYHMVALTRLKRFEEAYKIATKAYETFKFKSTDLFVEKHIYDWRFFLEYSVTAYYSHHYQQAYALGQRLMEEGKYPDVQTPVIEKNMGFFRSKLALKAPPTYLSRKFNLHPPMIVIVDDFLPNPDNVRKFALAQAFTVKGNYPGMRTKPFGTMDHKEVFEKILRTKISYWPTGLHSYNGAFQYTYGHHVSWIHRDLTDYSAMIYLTPDPPPEGGTLTYRHKKSRIERDSEASSKEQIDQMNNDSLDEDKWEKMDVIANKYNRLIIFSGRRSHRSNKYFGSTRQNGRLFQTFFFNVEGYH